METEVLENHQRQGVMFVSQNSLTGLETKEILTVMVVAIEMKIGN